jgi:hypothetical protein
VSKEQQAQDKTDRARSLLSVLSLHIRGLSWYGHTPIGMGRAPLCQSLKPPWKVHKSSGWWTILGLCVSSRAS